MILFKSQLHLLLLFIVTLSFTHCKKDGNSTPLDYLDGWPPHVDFDPSDEPVVSLPADPGQWDTLEFPLTVNGQDNGKQTLLYSLMLSHYWLLRNQASDGNYLYDWNADTDTSSTDNVVIQQLATAWSQVLLYRFLERPEFLLAARRAVAQNRTLTVMETPDGTIGYSRSLAQTMFLLFATLEIESVRKTGDHLEEIGQMGRFLLAQVDDDGCIRTAARDFSSSCPGMHSEFAVGQALVAMERLYRFTGDTVWQDALEKSALYYHDFYHGPRNWKDDVYWIPWASGPLVALVLARPNPDLEAWIFRMSDWMLEDQYRPPDREDYIGGFKRKAGNYPTWGTVSMIEGVIDAYRLAEARGDAERTALYAKRIRYALHFLLGLQYRADNVGSLNLANPERAIGAYHFSHWGSLKHYVRTDYMDHFAVTILKAVHAMDLEGYPGPGFAVLEPSDKSFGEFSGRD